MTQIQKQAWKYFDHFIKYIRYDVIIFTTPALKVEGSGSTPVYSASLNPIVWGIEQDGKG